MCRYVRNRKGRPGGPSDQRGAPRPSDRRNGPFNPHPAHPVLLASVVVHEVAHAWQALREGRHHRTRPGPDHAEPDSSPRSGGIHPCARGPPSASGELPLRVGQTGPGEPAQLPQLPRAGDIRVSMAGIVANLGLVALFAFGLALLTSSGVAAPLRRPVRFNSVKYFFIHLRCLHKPDSSVLQPDPHSSARRVPRPLPPSSPVAPRPLPSRGQVRNRHPVPDAARLPRRIRGACCRPSSSPLTGFSDRPSAMTDDGLLLVDTDRFHGPLDLLLHLIRTQDIDIFDIPDRAHHAVSSWTRSRGWPTRTWTKRASSCRWRPRS